MKKGRVFLIPTFLSESNDAGFIAPMVTEILRHTTCFLVENVRTARRYISALNLGLDISGLTFHEMDKRWDPAVLPDWFAPVLSGLDMGIISEAGMPGIADPGKLAVAYAHQQDVEVVALPGASSILLALVSSGFNGQQFTFHGYLPIEAPERNLTLVTMEKTMEKTGYTQLFMETPYRNNALLEAMFAQLKPSTHLYIGADLTGERMISKSKTIGWWKKNRPDLHKIPTLYSIGRS
ncbi:MAG: SAM-dependent methyltransferase [Cyclobacteriaceae bacterium]|nr:SAM-dependent methyltransferase [Cyclobacteriaceae bacterium]